MKPVIHTIALVFPGFPLSPFAKISRPSRSGRLAPTCDPNPRSFHHPRKNKIPCHRLPYHAMMCFLQTTYFLKYCPYHLIHQYVEDHGGGWFYLVHPSPFPKQYPKVLTYFGYDPMSLPVVLKYPGQVWPQPISSQ